MTIPPALTLKTVLDASYRPQWWFNFLTTEPLTFATLSGHSGSVADLITTMFDPTLTFDDLAWIREAWTGKLFVKGIQNVEDAVRAADHGVDGIVVSSHGGRQLDRAPVPLHVLPQTGPPGLRRRDHPGLRDHVGRRHRRGPRGRGGLHDGRPRLPLRPHGRRPARGGAGHRHPPRRDMRRTLALLGTPTLADLSSDSVRLRPSS